jgi:hypothetical protein
MKSRKVRKQTILPRGHRLHGHAPVVIVTGHTRTHQGRRATNGTIGGESMKPTLYSIGNGLMLTGSTGDRFRTSAPKVRVRNERKAKLTRKRMRELRARVKDVNITGRRGRCDQVRFYQVPLLDSTVDRLAVDLKVERADDRPITELEWRKLVGLVVAQAIKLTIDRKR